MPLSTLIIALNQFINYLLHSIVNYLRSCTYREMESDDETDTDNEWNHNPSNVNHDYILYPITNNIDYINNENDEIHKP